nr:vacuolar protein-sorting-associated protein 37 homolog 1-like [Tanacetum cinerariifolium]
MFTSFWDSQEQHQTQVYGDRPLTRIPPETAGIIHVLKDKSGSELQTLLSSREAYQHFLLSLDMVQSQIR